MKVRCIKTSIDRPNRYITNCDMDEYLSVGSLFWVYGIRFFKSIVYIYIFDNEHLFEVPLELFECLDNKTSNEWKIKVWNAEEVTLWPDLFYEDGFFENFSEREVEERNEFATLRIAMEQ